MLRQKEMDLARLQKEIEALRLVIPLLTEEQVSHEALSSEQRDVAPDKTGTDGPTFSWLGHTERSFWRRRRESEE